MFCAPGDVRRERYSDMRYEDTLLRVSRIWRGFWRSLVRPSLCQSGARFDLVAFQIMCLLVFFIPSNSYADCTWTEYNQKALDHLLSKGVPESALKGVTIDSEMMAGNDCFMGIYTLTEALKANTQLDDEEIRVLVEDVVALQNRHSDQNQGGWKLPSEVREGYRRTEIERTKRRETFKAKREETKRLHSKDVVIQVLNYMSTGSDEGTDSIYWFPTERGGQIIKCNYTWVDGSDSGELDVNGLDPKSLKVGHNDFGAWVYHDAKPIVKPDAIVSFALSDLGQDPYPLSGGAGRDPDRLMRGLELIFTDHCEGRKRAF